MLLLLLLHFVDGGEEAIEGPAFKVPEEEVSRGAERGGELTVYQRQLRRSCREGRLTQCPPTLPWQIL